jgi:hypothetical protein
LSLMETAWPTSLDGWLYKESVLITGFVWFASI